jgi:hypothetical protein
MWSTSRVAEACPPFERAAEGRLRQAAIDLEARVQTGWERLEPRRQLRSVVDRVDEAIRACEEAHLRQLHEVNDELAAHAREVFVEALPVLECATGDPARPPTPVPAVPRRIDHLMDLLWSLQERTFDALAPWRRELALHDE